MTVSDRASCSKQVLAKEGRDLSLTCVTFRRPDFCKDLHGTYRIMVEFRWFREETELDDTDGSEYVAYSFAVDLRRFKVSSLSFSVRQISQFAL